MRSREPDKDINRSQAVNMEKKGILLREPSNDCNLRDFMSRAPKGLLFHIILSAFNNFISHAVLELLVSNSFSYYQFTYQDISSLGIKKVDLS